MTDTNDAVEGVAPQLRRQWGIEQTSDTLWIGPMRDDGRKVDAIAFSLDYSPDYTTAGRTQILALAEAVIRQWNAALSTPTQTADAVEAVFEARFCPDIPTDCCNYGVISHQTGKEVCRVWLEEDARQIADLLNVKASPPAPDTTHNAELVEELQRHIAAAAAYADGMPHLAENAIEELAGFVGDNSDRILTALRTPDSDLLREALEENAKLRADLKKHGEHEEMYSCEGCGAPLYTDDEYVGDDCHGCWATMTSNHPSSTGMPCYAYRVNKPSAENLARLSPAQKGGA